MTAVEPPITPPGVITQESTSRLLVSRTAAPLAPAIYLAAAGAVSFLAALLLPRAAPHRLLTGHMDVVPAEPEGWDSDPFTLTQRHGCYVARGATDMKGFLQELHGSGIQTPVDLNLSCCDHPKPRSADVSLSDRWHSSALMHATRHGPTATWTHRHR